MSRTLDAKIASDVMGLNVVALDWPCGYDMDDGSYVASMFRECSYLYPERGPVYVLNEGDWPPETIDGAECPVAVFPVPNYSTEIADAWEVVEHIRQQKCSVQAEFVRALREAAMNIDGRLRDPFWWFLLHADAPNAICKAALKAVQE